MLTWYKLLKQNIINVSEAVVHVDFSENYTCKNTEEIQIAHFGGINRQTTLHAGVIYKSDELQPFTTISDSLRHDPPAIWAHLEPVLRDLRETNLQIIRLHFYSDDPITQYHNKQKFFLLFSGQQSYKKWGFTFAR